MLQTRIFVLEFLAEKEQMYPQKNYVEIGEYWKN